MAVEHSRSSPYTDALALLDAVGDLDLDARWVTPDPAVLPAASAEAVLAWSGRDELQSPLPSARSTVVFAGLVPGEGV